MAVDIRRICPNCRKVFPTFEAVISDEARRTNDIFSWQYRCPGCQTLFPMKEIIIERGNGHQHHPAATAPAKNGVGWTN